MLRISGIKKGHNFHVVDRGFNELGRVGVPVTMIVMGLRWATMKVFVLFQMDDLRPGFFRNQREYSLSPRTSR